MQLTPEQTCKILDWPKHGPDCSTVTSKFGQGDTTADVDQHKKRKRSRKSLKSVLSSLPLVWRSKHPEVWCEILQACYAGKVTDFLPGDFSAGAACVMLGLPYTAFCFNDAHAAFGQRALQAAIVQQMSVKDSWCYMGEEVANTVKEHFPEKKETAEVDDDGSESSSGSE